MKHITQIRSKPNMNDAPTLETDAAFAKLKPFLPDATPPKP